MSANSGFTLVELLVVLIIITVITSVACFSFGDFGTSRQALATAKEFSAWLTLLQQNAILETRALGVTLRNHGYDTVIFEEDRWQAPKRQFLFRPHIFPEKVQLICRIGCMKKEPHIIIDASGNMPYFKIDFIASSKTSVTLTNSHHGELSLERHTP